MGNSFDAEYIAHPIHNRIQQVAGKRSYDEHGNQLERLVPRQRQENERCTKPKVDVVLGLPRRTRLDTAPALQQRFSHVANDQRSESDEKTESKPWMVIDHHGTQVLKERRA